MRHLNPVTEEVYGFFCDAVFFICTRAQIT